MSRRGGGGHGGGGHGGRGGGCGGTGSGNTVSFLNKINHDCIITRYLFMQINNCDVTIYNYYQLLYNDIQIM